MKTWFLIPFDCFKGREFFNKLILCTSLLALSGCLTTGKSKPLAPSPPSVTSRSLSAQQSDIAYQPHYFSAPLQVALLQVETSPIIDKGVDADIVQLLPLKGARDAVSSLDKCRMKDRFDRKAVLAYEWGRSRLALDVGGVNLNGGSDKDFRLEYKIKLQPEKTRKQRCRYSSSWQGLIGSGYNELFLRQENTVWGEVKEVKTAVTQYIDRIF